MTVGSEFFYRETAFRCNSPLVFLPLPTPSLLLPHFQKMHRLSTNSSRSLRRAAAKASKPTLTRGAHKEIKFSNEGRASILKGVDVLANAVSVTLGPKGV